MLYGVIPEKIDLRDFKVCSSNVYVKYPDEFQLKNLPVVKNQGNVNSCCAHATSSILEYYDSNKHVLSTNFFYGIQKKICYQNGQGMYLKDACKIASKYGDMLETDCPGNTEVPECRKVAEESFNDLRKRAEAFKYRIRSYYSCKSSNDIKYALMKYGPVLVSVCWHEKYKLVNNVIEFNKNSLYGLHAVVIIGWNKTGWIIQNSWGTSFGDKGRFILPFEHGVTEAKVMIDDKSNNILDNALVVPSNNNKISDSLYKIINWFLNTVKCKNKTIY